LKLSSKDIVIFSVKSNSYGKKEGSMKKPIVVVLVLLLVSMVTYGADYWYSPNPTCIRPISGYTHVGIGTSNPAAALHVNGTALVTGFRLTTGAHSGYVLTSNSSGVGTWQPAPSGGGGSCLWDEGSGGIYYDGGSVGIFDLGNNNGVSILAISENTNTLDEFVFKGDFAGTGETGNALKLETHWANNVMTWRGDGNVGIGTTNPGYKLHVEGGQTYANYYSNDGTYALTVENTGGDGCGLDVKAGYGTGKGGTIARFRNQQGDSVTIKENGATSIKMYSDTNYALNVRNTSGNGLGLDVWAGYGYDTTGIVARFRTTTNTCMIIRENGNVGIGTDDPGNYRLAVNGHIRTKEITVESDWSDFVFEDDYELMPLDRLEQHIKVNKSLPGIPTEEEVLKGGVKVGEIQAKLLEKVEELTLYVIELKKENEKLQKRITALEN
jgi:hypothetical protein